MTSERPLRLGTRGSLLATTQSGWVAARLTEATGRAVELVIITTRGDQVRDRPLAKVGGKGLFTKELEDALLAGEVDLAVHSMKDMPTEGPDGLAITAVPVREDPRDALVGAVLADLAAGAVVGTGSARRGSQIALLRPDLEVRGIRGNVPTRIRKMEEGEYDAVVLAYAGLRRLGLGERAADLLDVDRMIAAAGQGALAVQSRADDDATNALLATIHDPATAACVAVERAFLQRVGGGCSAPVACHARREGGGFRAWAFVADEDGHNGRRVELTGDAEGLPERLADALG